MRFGIQTWGSEGDIRPLLALGHGLKEIGHDVVIAITSIENRDYAERCEDLGLEYIRVPGNVDFDKADFGHKHLDTNGLEWTARMLEAAFVPYQEDMYDVSMDLCRTCDAVIGHYMVHPLKAAAQASLAPYISVTLSHGSTPTDQHPPGILINRGAYANQLAWKLHLSVQDTALRPLIQDFWLRHKLPTMKHVYEYWTSDLLDLVTVSPVFRDEPEDWAPRHRMCGFLDVSCETDELPKALQAFLDDGPPPVFLSLGVLMKFDPNHYMILAREAVKQAECRAIIHVSPEMIDQWPADKCSGDGRIYYEGPINYKALFPHCSAIVHHGTAATAHSAVLCGAPSLIVGFQDEQMFWGKQLEMLGVAEAPIIHQNVTAENLATGIKKVLANQSLAQKAKELSGQIAKEDGIQKAVDLIHEILPLPGI